MPVKKKASIRRRLFIWCLKFLLVLWVCTLCQVFLLRFANPPFTATTLWRWIRSGNFVKDHRLYNSWKTLDEISPHLRKAVLAGEDQRFLSHHGFDFTEMNMAIRDILFKKQIRGASTITMQTARTVFLWPHRDLFRKTAEAYYTVLIELFWNKERILEIYINTVDWGNNLMGAERASKKYFHTSASGLSRYQAALLVAILPNPHEWTPVRPGRQVLTRQKKILKDMKKMPLIG